MTPRERVLSAFAHEEPDRVPRWCGASPEFTEKAKRELGIADTEALFVRFGDDFRRVYARDPPPETPLSPGSTSRSAFGVERHGIGAGIARNHPLAGASLGEIAEHPWPDPDRVDVSGIRERALAWGGAYAILGGDWSPFWHDALDLLGPENLFVQMYEAPAIVDAVLGRVVDYYFEVSRRIFDEAAGAIDIFFIGNDFGSRSGPLIGKRAFDRFILPHLRRLADLGRSYGLRVLLHSCGGIEPLIPSFIEAGVDGIHAVQPSCRGMDLERLKALYGERLLLSGAIDSQRVLIEGAPEAVREAVRRTIEVLAPGGGYVAGASHDYILEETPVANVLAMFDAVEEFGAYPIRS